LSVLYGIQFDVKFHQLKANEMNLQAADSAINGFDEQYGECWRQLSHRANIEYEVQTNQSLAIQAEQERLAAISAPRVGDFPLAESVGNSTKWLLNVLMSFLTSVFIWQPLSIYILTWMKIWAFHNGLIMEASLYNLCQFLCCCFFRCAKSKSRKHHKQMLEFSMADSSMNQNGTANNSEVGYPTSPKKMSYVREDSEVELSVSGSSGFGPQDRALDLIGFLYNDDLFVDLPDDFDVSFT